RDRTVTGVQTCALPIYPGRKAEAVASVLVDRVLGLYALLLVAAVASLLLPAGALARLPSEDQAIVRRLCWCVQTVSLMSSIGLEIGRASCRERVWIVLG